MSRPLTQLLPPDLPAGATSPQFGVSNPAGSGPQGGHLTSMTNLKSLLQLPIKADQRSIKDSCEMKGERACVRASPHVDGCVRVCAREKLLKGTVVLVCLCVWLWLFARVFPRARVSESWGRGSGGLASPSEETANTPGESQTLQFN